jgi:hypothetical protein
MERSRLAIAATAGAIVLLVVGFGSQRACAAHPSTLPGAGPILARGAENDTVADLFGINEAVGIPARFVAMMPPADKDAWLEERIATTKSLGIRHVRVHSANYPNLSFDHAANGTDEVDRALGHILAAGLVPDVMIGPWPGNAPGDFTNVYVPADLDAYGAWVTGIVERYDGDGIADAPGIGPGVHLWEVDNEPDLHATVPPRSRPEASVVTDFETAADYAQVAKVTIAAIHAADPAATVLPAGLWAPFDPRFADYDQALWKQPEFAAEFAAINVHGYPRAGVADLWNGVDALTAVAPDHGVWITETSTSSATPADQHAQAVDLAAIYLEALRRGVARVYWHSLQETPAPRLPPTASDRAKSKVASRYPGAATLGHHLFEFTDPPTRKLSAWVMADLLARYGAIPRSTITGLPSDGAAIAVGADQLVWSNTGQPSVVVEGLSDGAVTITPIVPDEPDGASVAGQPHWTSKRDRVKDGRLVVDVRGGPVRIAKEG